MGVFTLHASNIKWFAFEFAFARPVWIRPWNIVSLLFLSLVICRTEEIVSNIWLNCFQCSHRRPKRERKMEKCNDLRRFLPESPGNLSAFCFGSCPFSRKKWSHSSNNCILENAGWTSHWSRNQSVTKVCQSVTFVFADTESHALFQLVGNTRK